MAGGVARPSGLKLAVEADDVSDMWISNVAGRGKLQFDGSSKGGRPLTYFYGLLVIAISVGLSIVSPATAIGAAASIVCGVAIVRFASGVLSRDPGFTLLGLTVSGYTVASSVLPLPQHISFTLRYVSAAALLLFLISRYGWRPSKEARPIIYAFAAAWIWAATSSIWSITPKTSFLQAGSMGLLFLVVGALVLRWQHRDPTSDFGVIYGVVLMSITAGLVAWGVGLDIASLGLGVRGIHANPNGLGAISALVLPFGTALAIQKRNWALGVVLLVPIMALLLSNSFTSILAGLSGLVLVLFQLRRALRRVSGTFIICFLVGGTLALTVTEEGQGFADGIISRTNSILQGEEAAEYTSRRTIRWEDAWRAWQERAIVGYGYRSSHEVFEERYSVGLSETRGNVHNGYLQGLVEVGLVGLMLLLVPIIYAVAQVGRGSLVRIGLRGSLVAGLIVQLAESFLVAFGSIFAMMFWVLVGALAVQPKAHQARSVRRAWVGGG